MNNKKFTYVCGALLIALGVLFVLSPKGVFESIVLFAGISIIAISAFGIILSLSKESTSYFIGSSILGLIFGIILVSNTDSAVKTIPILLGLWLFISGVSTTIYMSKMGSKLTTMTSSITRIILGLICFMAPVIPISIVGIFIGVILVLSGISLITNVKDEEIVYKVKVKK